MVLPDKQAFRGRCCIRILDGAITLIRNGLSQRQSAKVDVQMNSSPSLKSLIP